MLYLHFANRQETLLAGLLQRLADGTADVFTAEPVIVPNAAHRRWLSLAMADTFGVCANVEFAYLARWLWQQVARVVPQVGAESPFAAAPLTWRVWRAFGDAGFVDAFPRLRHYLRSADAPMRHELAQRVAALFEQYVTYRPDWLQAWAAGDRVSALDAPPARADEAWQAELWRRLQGEVAGGTAHPRQAFADALVRRGPQLALDGVLPGRAHLFALPTIAPLHLQMLQPLARCIDVHVYAVSPCREYWYEIVSPRRLASLRAAGKDAGHETGNSLLASWGRQAQEHLETLDALCGEGAEDDFLYQRAPGASLLAQVQNALLELCELAPGSVQLDPGDRSLEVHVCHSLARELEVLHDVLLGLFAGDESLRPADIVVLVPDLDAAAPLVDAVFGAVPKDRRIDYSFAARPPSRANLPARALLAVLTLVSSRCTATEILAALQQPTIARRFGFDDAALQRVRDWLQSAGFRWALDPDQLVGLGPSAPETGSRPDPAPGEVKELGSSPSFFASPDARHTLDHALQRLFLGHALPEGASGPFGDLLPAGDAEGTDARHLGALWRFASRLQRARAELASAAPPRVWVQRLHTLIGEFVLAAADEADELRELQEAIAAMADPMRQAAPDEALPLAVVRAALEQALDEPARGGAPGGAVTFASLRALRGLPYPVVCAIGLNDGAFPAPDRPAEFDLMAQVPRRGDRRPRDEQRALMLDLLLGARRRLMLSYTGRDQRSNEALPPSVLVSELLDVVVPAIAELPAAPESRERARRRLVVEHPLQAFSLDAFRVDGADERLRSFDHELADALRASVTAAPAGAGRVMPHGADDDDEEDNGADPQLPFFAQPLGAPGPEWRDVTLAQLIRFFRNPCRGLLGKRLRIDLPRAEDALADDEAFVPDRDGERALARRLMPALLEGIDDDSLAQLARCGDEAPAGAFGTHWLRQQLSELRAFAEAVRQARAGARIEGASATLPLQLDDGTWQLRIDFDGLHAGGLVGWRFARTGAADYLDPWLRHLALCAATPAGVVPRTQWINRDGRFEFRPCADASARLADLLRLYAQGLAAPLHFFPRAAWAYVKEDGSLKAARKTWEVTDFAVYPEGADPAYALALRGIDDPLDGDFERLARAVFDPLVAHLIDPRVQGSCA